MPAVCASSHIDGLLQSYNVDAQSICYCYKVIWKLIIISFSYHTFYLFFMFYWLPLLDFVTFIHTVPIFALTEQFQT